MTVLAASGAGVDVLLALIIAFALICAFAGSVER